MYNQITNRLIQQVFNKLSTNSKTVDKIVNKETPDKIKILIINKLCLLIT